MVALVKGISGSATFRSPAGSWAMRVAYASDSMVALVKGGRRCRMLGRRRGVAT